MVPENDDADGGSNFGGIAALRKSGLPKPKNKVIFAPCYGV